MLQISQEVGTSYDYTPHILVADDEYALHTLFRTFLGRIGYKATMVDSGAAAVDAVQSTPTLFQCAVLDVMMPTMSGIEAAQKVHRLAPNISIILMTGWNPHPVPADLPLVGFLHKPFTFGEFRQLLQQALPAAVEAERTVGA